MGLNKKSVDDINVKGQRVLVRCDFNVPLIDGKITDENRIVAALPTIKKLIADGGKVILCSHLGKPKGEPKPELSLAPVAVRLAELLGQDVKFAADPEVVGENAKRYFLNEIQKKAGTPFIATPTEPIKKIGLAFEAIFNNTCHILRTDNCLLPLTKASFGYPFQWIAMKLRAKRLMWPHKKKATYQW